MSDHTSQTRLCPECGGSCIKANIINDVRWSLDGGYYSDHDFIAFICISCGYTSFYAQGRQNILQELEKRNTKEEQRRAKEADKQLKRQQKR